MFASVHNRSYTSNQIRKYYKCLHQFMIDHTSGQIMNYYTCLHQFMIDHTHLIRSWTIYYACLHQFMRDHIHLVRPWNIIHDRSQIFVKSQFVLIVVHICIRKSGLWYYGAELVELFTTVVHSQSVHTDPPFWQNLHITPPPPPHPL